MDYFDKYSPEEEDIFGSNVTVRPVRVEPSQAQINDPLRKWKVTLNSHLCAEKTPITAHALSKRLWDEQGMRFEPGYGGFESLEDLLHGLPEEVVVDRMRDGSFVYSAKTNSANSAIRGMVAKQNDSGSSTSRNKSFLYTNKKIVSNHGSAFKAYNGPTIKDNAASTSTAKNITIKNRYPKTTSKTEERAKVAAQYLADEWDNLCEPHPSDPNDQQKSVVTLAKLQHSFTETFTLPLWGKKMKEIELYNALDQPPFNNHLRMYRIAGRPVVYVEPVNCVKGVYDTNSTAIPEEVFETIVEEEDAKITNTSIKSAPESKMEDLHLLENWQDTDGQFARGPGFSEERAASPVMETVHKKVLANTGGSLRITRRELKPVSVRMIGEDLHQFQNTSQFGEGPRFNAHSRDSSVTVVGRAVEQRSESRCRPVSCVPSDKTLRQLAHYCNHRGTLNYEHLNEIEKRIVTHNVDVFRTYSVSLGETLVQLNGDKNIEKAKFRYGNLRAVVEPDIRWMSESSSSIGTNGPFLGRVVHFVPPRGFLLVDLNASRESTILDKMNQLLIDSSEERKPLEVQDLYPGLACVYHYNVNGSSQWFRVLIIKASANKSKGCVGAILVDMNDRYFCEIEVSELYELSSQFSFQKYRPNVVYAVLCGVNSINENTQKELLDVLEGESKNYDYEKPAIPAYFYQTSGNAVPLFDMIWLDDRQDLQWMTNILREKDGAVMNNETKFLHYSESVDQIYKDCNNPELYQYRGSENVTEGADDREADVVIRRRTLTQEEEDAIRAHISENTSANHETSHLSTEGSVLVEAQLVSPTVLAATYEVFLLTKNVQVIQAIEVLVDAMAKKTGDSVWTELHEKMKNDATEQLGVNIYNRK